MGSNNIQKLGRGVSLTEKQGAIARRRERGYWEGKKMKNDKCSPHSLCPFILLLAFEIYKKNGPSYNNIPLNYLEK